jgi:hypothetical protein
LHIHLRFPTIRLLVNGGLREIEDRCIRAFLISSLQKMEYAAVTPKGNHLSINLAGKEVRTGLMDGICMTAEREPSIRKAFFNIVSGSETYKKTWRETRSPRLILKTAARAVFFRFSRKPRTRSRSV